jgi:hypothetical protein
MNNLFRSCKDWQTLTLPVDLFYSALFPEILDDAF